MLVDVFDPRGEAPRVFTVGVTDWKIAALLDGSGDWGSGNAAAGWARDALLERWSTRVPTSPKEVAEHVRQAVSELPSTLQDPEFGLSFSAVVLLCSADAVSAVCSGVYALRLVRHGSTRIIFRPRLLADDLVAEGHMTPEQVKTYPHRNVCVGPSLGVSDELILVEQEMQPGDRVVVSHHLRESTGFDGALALAGSATQVAASMAQGKYPSPTIVVTRP